MKISSVKHTDLIALKNIEGCGVATTRKICEYINERQADITMPNDLFRLIPEMKNKKVIKGKLSNLSLYDIENAYKKAKIIIENSLKREIGIISIYDSDYPEVLKSTIDENGKLDAPLLLYYRGNLSALKMPTIAIIGTREPNSDGMIAGRYFGKAFSELGFNIVSGLAIGCDSCGHEGALEGKGITTAFLAHGLDTIYPSQNKELAESIIKEGLLLSEYPVGTQASRFSLVARDRLQAGLALATLVIQTGVQGGTMHAANTTLLVKKPLYAVKYKDMSAHQVQGNIALVKKGAKFITSNDDAQMVADSIQKSHNNSQNTQKTIIEPTLFSNME